jgi:hypothetical protein
MANPDCIAIHACMQEGAFMVLEVVMYRNLPIATEKSYHLLANRIPQIMAAVATILDEQHHWSLKGVTFR